MIARFLAASVLLATASASALAEDHAGFATYQQFAAAPLIPDTFGCRQDFSPGVCASHWNFHRGVDWLDERTLAQCSTAFWPLPVANTTMLSENCYSARASGSNIVYEVFVSPARPVQGITFVPLRVHAIGSAVANASVSNTRFEQAQAGATSTVSITYAGGSHSWGTTITANASVPGGQATDTKTFNLLDTIMLRVSEGSNPLGAYAVVTISTNLRIGGSIAVPSGPTHADATAMADPEIVIDPDFPDRDSYRLYISRNLRCAADKDDGSGTGTPDGGVTLDDLLYYLALYAEGNPDADLDDGTGTWTYDRAVTIDDLLFFLQHYEAGC